MPLRSYFLDHLWLKLFSLILATLLWLTIRSNLDQDTREVTRRFDNVAVALLSDTAERRTFALDPAQVSVTVKGPKAVIDGLGDIHAYVELASHAGNTGNYTVEVLAPAGVTVVLVSPRTVFVRQSSEGQ